MNTDYMILTIDLKRIYLPLANSTNIDDGRSGCKL
jgi:hypothetical protein